MANDAVVLLVDAGEEAGDVHERNEGDVEGVAETDEAGGLGAADTVAVEGAEQSQGFNHRKRGGHKRRSSWLRLPHLLSMSRHPAECAGLLPTTPTVLPSILARHVVMLGAKVGIISNTVE